MEHDAEEIWRSTLEAGREALERAGGAAPADGSRPAGPRRGETQVVAIGITNQRETVVVWDRATGRPVHRAIVWQDRRTAERCRGLSDRAEEIRRKTGLVPDPYFSATKLEWLLSHDTSLRRRAEAGELAAGTVDSWLVFKLSGGRLHLTDPSNASRTMLYDIEARSWDDDLLRLFGVPGGILPEVRPSSEVLGVALAEWFGAEIPIAGIAGDQQAALFGQGCFAPGSAKNTYGTGAFLLVNTGKRRVHARHGLLTTLACDASGGVAYALEGSVFIAGAAIQWLRDGLGLIATAADTARLAAEVPDTGGVYFVPAFVGLGAPHWEAEARGTIVGLTRGTTTAHLVRAALEAMAYSSKDVLDVMTAESGLALADLKVDGGAAANDWLMQFQADVLGIPVRRPEIVESTGLGAAALAGLAAGLWPSAEAFVAARSYIVFRPGGRPESRAAAARAGHDGWQRALRAALSWARDR